MKIKLGKDVRTRIKSDYRINENDFISVPFEMQFINSKRFYTGGSRLIAIMKEPM